MAAGEFSQPPPQGARIPPSVPMDKLDPERAKLYAGLDARLEEPEEPTQPSLPIPSPPEPDLDDQYYLPDEEDKKAFLRALLGGKQFEKRFSLYGTIEASMVDRTTDQTEALYTALETDSKAGKIRTETDEQWITWVERYRLASSLSEYKDANGPKRYTATTEFLERTKELMKMPKPLYAAFMQTSRRFEAVVDVLTRRAHDPGFWKTGGASSPSKPM
jgi:hypothetical protein